MEKILTWRLPENRVFKIRFLIQKITRRERRRKRRNGARVVGHKWPRLRPSSLFISLSSLVVLVVVFFVRIGVVVVVLFFVKVRRCKPKFFLFTVNVNRVLETRFTSGCHVGKVPTQTRSKHENRPSKTWFIGPKSSLLDSKC